MNNNNKIDGLIEEFNILSDGAGIVSVAIKNEHTVYKIWKVNSDVLDRRIHNCIIKMSMVNIYFDHNRLGWM